MDAQRFDALTRAVNAVGSRRGLLATLLTLPGLSALLTLLDADDTEAKGRRKRRKKRHKHGKGNGRHRKGQRKKCKRKSRAKICAGTCGIIKNRKTCKKKVDCGPCAACSATQPCPSGCCAGDGSCQAGTSPQACGVVGATCQVCGETQLCQSGTCQDCDVCPSGCDNDTIGGAITDAQAGDTILICAGTYQETITISESLTLLGAGQGEDGTVLDGNGVGPVVEVDGGVLDVALQGLRITGGGGLVRGAGVLNFGELTLTDCTVTDNEALGDENTETTGRGGGIYSFGDLNLTGCTVSGNRAYGGSGGSGGGGIDNENGGTLTLSDCKVSGNTVDNGVGGGIFNHGRAAVSLQGSSHVCENTVDGEPNNCVGFTPPAGVCTETCPP